MLVNTRHSFLFLVPLCLSYALADSNLTSPVAPSDFKTHSRRARDGLTNAKTFQLIDGNKDGKLSLYELQDAAGFMWNDHETTNRARVTFRIPHPADFILSYDSDGDGQLSPDEFAESMTEIEVKSSTECASLSTHLDTCKTHEIIQCSAYINTAEQMCRMGHSNVIEQCILNSPCGAICGCIREAEKAAHHDSVLVLQYPDGRQEYASDSALIMTNSTNEVGHHEKRFFLLFLGLILAAVLNIAISAALISISEIEQNTGKQVGFMDFDVWNSDSGNPPPSCTIYVFWSTQCGPILSGKARGCSNGGTRLYQNSCKDHFRYGSRGCGFLDLGCRSLCYAVNDQGCPCSIFDKWTEQDNIDYPGNDVETLHVQKLSDCRSACASSTACRAFVVPPPDGTDNQINCYLKGDLGSFVSRSGMISFIKITTDEKTCPTSLVGRDFGALDRRELEAEYVSGKGLVKRIGDDDIKARAFPFDPTDPRFVAFAQFLVALYRSYWINREQVQRTSYETTLTAIGSLNLTPDPREPVADTSNPRWRVSDGWRPINVFRALLSLGRGGETHPVAALMGQQGTGGLNDIAAPPALRQLLINNEAAILASNRAWAGQTGTTAPHPGVQIAYGRTLGFHQGGAQGPYPMEVAFILAMQLAGIDVGAVARRAVNRPLTWLNAIVPRAPGENAVPQCLRQYAPGREFVERGSRRIGFIAREGVATGDPGAGFYIVVDVDGELDESANPNRNVFVFAVHTIDPHSRINVPNRNNLRSLTYNVIHPSAVGEVPAGPSNQAQQRFFAHGHAGWFPYASIRNFMLQDPDGTRVPFPDYRQIGSFHLYILSEDENSVHPRQQYLQDDKGARKHDEL